MLATHLLPAVLVSFAAAVSLLTTTSAYAGRCNTGLISGQYHCGDCPDPATLPNPCPPGEEMVIYDLGKPFGFDGTTMSGLTMRAAPRSSCGAGFEKHEGVDGYLVGCWSPPDRQGCRTLHTPNNGFMCLRVDDEPLGCGGECGLVRTGQIAISNSGAADRYICPPQDSQTCRSTRGYGREERFRLWVGGFCSTNGCEINDPLVRDDDAPGKATCSSEWGATQFGYSRGKTGRLSPPGFYHWKTGSFSLEVTDGRSTCGDLGKCLGRPGNRHPWTLRIVGTPRPGSKLPCLSTHPCSPLPIGNPACM